MSFFNNSNGAVVAIQQNVLATILVGGLAAGTPLSTILSTILRVAAVQSVVYTAYNSELPTGGAYEKKPIVNITGDPSFDDVIARFNNLVYADMLGGESNGGNNNNDVIEFPNNDDHDDDDDTVPPIPSPVRRRRHRKVSRGPVRRSVRVMDNSLLGSIIVGGRRRSARLMVAACN